MNKFVKLNVFAALYGFVMFVQTEIMMNVYRFFRITNMSIDYIKSVSNKAMLVIFIVSTIVFFIISKRYFNKGGLRFLLVILWFPYYFIFARLSGIIFPMARADDPGPGLGIIFLAFLLVYPLYIAIITAISTKIDDVWHDF